MPKIQYLPAIVHASFPIVNGETSLLTSLFRGPSALMKGLTPQLQHYSAVAYRVNNPVEGAYQIYDSGVFSIFGELKKGKIKDIEKHLNSYADAYIDYLKFHIKEFGHDMNNPWWSFVEIDLHNQLGMDWVRNYRKRLIDNFGIDHIRPVFRNTDAIAPDGKKRLDEIIYGGYKQMAIAGYAGNNFKETAAKVVVNGVRPNISKANDLYALCSYIKERNPNIKIHLLGVSNFDIINKVQDVCDSCDSEASVSFSGQPCYERDLESSGYSWKLKEYNELWHKLYLGHYQRARNNEKLFREEAFGDWNETNLAWPNQFGDPTKKGMERLQSSKKIALITTMNRRWKFICKQIAHGDIPILHAWHPTITEYLRLYYPNDWQERDEAFTKLCCPNTNREDHPTGWYAKQLGESSFVSMQINEVDGKKWLNDFHYLDGSRLVAPVIKQKEIDYYKLTEDEIKALAADDYERAKYYAPTIEGLPKWWLPPVEHYPHLKRVVDGSYYREKYSKK